MPEPVNKSTTKPASAMPPAFSIKELYDKDLPPQKWVVEGLFEAESIGMISGKSNLGKSWLALGAGVCVAGGTPFLGKFPVEQSPVLVWSAEDGCRILRKRLTMLGASPELPIYLHADQEFLLSDAIVDGLIAEVKAKGVGLVVIDPLADVHNGDENKTPEAVALMRWIRRLARSGTAVLVVHHQRKGSGQQGGGEASGDEARGSSVIHNSLDSHLTIRPGSTEADKSQIVLVSHPKMRNEKRLAPFRVRLAINEESAALTYEGEAKVEASANGSAKAVADALRNSGGRWLSLKDLIAGRVANAKNGLHTLKEAGQLATKTRKELETDGVALGSIGKHNEVFYALVSTPEPPPT